MTNAIAQPTTRTCTAWSYDKAECIPLWGGWLWDWVDWGGGKVPHNGWQDTRMLKQCIHAWWSIEQQAESESWHFFHLWTFKVYERLIVSGQTGSSSAVQTLLITAVLGVYATFLHLLFQNKKIRIIVRLCEHVFVRVQVLSFVVLPAKVPINLRYHFLWLVTKYWDANR